MVIREQNRIRTTYYNEAIRYMENARETLKKAGKEDRFYVDEKYCGIAYNGVLKALDGYLLLKGIEKKKGRKDIEYYQDAIAIIDRKLLNYINSAYKVLHLNGYYDGIRDARVIAEGFNLAYSIIERIKPAA
ncbi:MAG: DUF5618 family protein [Bacteroidetes bacterium]|nr:DUF5618 family protein [Bacteroidota bacterium]